MELLRSETGCSGRISLVEEVADVTNSRLPCGHGTRVNCGLVWGTTVDGWVGIVVPQASCSGFRCVRLSWEKRYGRLVGQSITSQN